MFTLVLAPHNDDEALFIAYTIMREHCLVAVVFDSYKQEWTTKDERRAETAKAMGVLGRPFTFLGVRDDTGTYEDVVNALQVFKPAKVYAPTGSHPHHEMVGRAAKTLWGDKVTFYTTYEGNELHVARGTEVKPTKHEMERKRKAMSCYKSQLKTDNKIHFDAVMDKSEYYDNA